LYVPVKPIPVLDAQKLHYVMVFYRDTLGKLDTKLQVFAGLPEYEKSNRVLDVKNFSGLSFQIALDGKVDKVFSFDDGKFEYKIKLKNADSNSGSTQLKPRGLCDGCWYVPDQTTIKRVVCFFCELEFAVPEDDLEMKDSDDFDIVGGGEWTFGYGNTNINWGVEPGGSTSGGGSGTFTGGSGGTSGTISSDGSLDSQLDNTAFEQLLELRYLNAGFSFEEYRAMRSNQDLFNQVDIFLNENGFTNENRLAVKGFNFLMDVDDDFKTANQNRGNKSIKELIDEFGYPNLKSSTLIGMARKNGIDVNLNKQNFTRLGRIQEDAVARSLGSYKNETISFKDPTGLRSAVVPDVIGNGFVSQWEIDAVSGVRYLNSWEGDQSAFYDSKFVASSEKLIKDNVETNANNTTREQLSTMIDVLSQMRGGWIKSVRNTLLKPSDHGIAFLVIVTFKDVEIDPNLIIQAHNSNVIMYKRWLIHDPETNKISVSTNYEDKTPFVATRKPGAMDPPNFGQFVDIDWTIQ
jgi:hypothetical protein